MEAADERMLHLSVLTLGEIRKGIVSMVEGKRRAELEAWLEIDLRRRFAGRILPVAAAIADRWGLLAGVMKRQGRPIPTIDAILAATAMHHELTLITRNVRDFEDAHVPVVNPWEA